MFITLRSYDGKTIDSTLHPGPGDTTNTLGLGSTSLYRNTCKSFKFPNGFHNFRGKRQAQICNFFSERRTGRFFDGPYETFTIHYQDGSSVVANINWDFRHEVFTLAEYVTILQSAINQFDLGAGGWTVTATEGRIVITDTVVSIAPGKEIVGFTGLLANIYGIDVGNFGLDTPANNYFFHGGGGVNTTWDIFVSLEISFSNPTDGKYVSDSERNDIHETHIICSGMQQDHCAQFWSDPGNPDTAYYPITMYNYKIDKHIFQIDLMDQLNIDVKIRDWYGQQWVHGDNNWVLTLKIF